MMASAITVLAKLLELFQPSLSKAQSEAFLSIAWFSIIRGYSWKASEFVAKQMNLESAFASDPKVDAYKNVFGMSRVTTRDTTSVGYVELSDGNTFATYKTIFDSVKDRFLWDDYFNIAQMNYEKDVSKIYHGSSGYEDAVNATSIKGLRVAFAILYSILPLSYLVFKKIF